MDIAKRPSKEVLKKERPAEKSVLYCTQLILGK